MDVTNENFSRLLPEITETIKSCDFIAIDTELSGLMRERNHNLFDSPAERFVKTVESSRGYFIMQFGLSCFTLCDAHHYTNKTYNFYIFPQATNYGDKDRTLAIQAHAIQFLIEHGFDFNILFKLGISYLTFHEKINLTALLKKETKDREKVKIEDGLPAFVPATMIDECRSWLKEVQRYLKQTRQANESDKLELRDCSTAHKRSIMRRVLECQPFFNSIIISVEQDTMKNESFLTVSYIDPLVKEEKQKNDLINAKGFLIIVENLIQNRKPIILHNSLLDIIHIISQFVEDFDDYSSFKELVSSLFPIIYDTKFIAHELIDPKTLTNNQSRLSDLYQQLRDGDTMTKIEVEHLGELIEGNQLPHQAGFDAYMSGYCFIILCQSYLNEKRKSKKGKLELLTSLSLVKNSHIQDLFANKVHMSYSYDHKFYNLGGQEPDPNRDHVFYIEHPNTWSLDDLFKLFHEAGGVVPARLNPTSHLVALKNSDKAKLVRKKAKEISHSNYKICPYEEYERSFKLRRGKDEKICDTNEGLKFFDAE